MGKEIKSFSLNDSLVLEVFEAKKSFMAVNDMKYMSTSAFLEVLVSRALKGFKSESS